MPNFILNINSISDDLRLQEPEIQCYILNSEMGENELLKQVEKLRAGDKIILLCGQLAVELCQRLDVDGVVIDLSQSATIKKDIEALRARLGTKILGVVCRPRRHEAMIVSENEPDFIIFRIWEEGLEKTLDLAKWYNEFFLLQMAVWAQDDNVEWKTYPADMVILTPQQYKIFVAKK